MLPMADRYSARRLSGLLSDIRLEAATLWRTPWSIAGGVLYGAVVGGFLVAVSVLHRPTFRFVTREDSIFEWLQFVAFAAAAVFAGLCAFRLWNKGERVPAALFALMGLSCVFIAGEEISWGQRLFGFETSESWKEINKQNETTLHNVGSVLLFFNLAMLVISLYAVIVSLAFIQRRPMGLWRWLIPPSYLITAFGTMAAYKAIRFTIVRGSGFTAVKLGEWAELCMAVGLAAFAIEIWRFAGRSPSTNTTASGFRTGTRGSAAQPDPAADSSA
jgi:hypothetical protein